MKCSVYECVCVCVCRVRGHGGGWSSIFILRVEGRRESEREVVVCVTARGTQRLTCVL